MVRIRTNRLPTVIKRSKIIRVGSYKKGGINRSAPKRPQKADGFVREFFYDFYRVELHYKEHNRVKDRLLRHGDTVCGVVGHSVGSGDTDL